MLVQVVIAVDDAMVAARVAEPGVYVAEPGASVVVANQWCQNHYPSLAFVLSVAVCNVDGQG